MAHFDALAAGDGDAETVALLRKGQWSKHAMLVRAVVDVAADGAPRDHAESGLEDAYHLLSAVQQEAPKAVEAMLLHPHVGAWAVHCLERLHNPPPTEAETHAPLRTDLGYLGAIAASAAITAGVAFEIGVPVRDGLAILPALGAARVQVGERWTTATVSGNGSAPVIATRAGEPAALRAGSGWIELRKLTASADGLAIQLDLDDLDAYRGHTYPSVADRLADTEAAQWQQLFGQAWALLVDQHRPYAVALAAGLRCLVPQISSEPGRSISATSTDAFGSVAMSRPSDPANFALTLVHEFQHAKLSALLDLVPMYEARSDVRYYAPWRDDPRPLGGLLQGVYAFLGVTDFWRVHRNQPLAAQSTAQAALAHFEFARWREQTSRAVEELSTSDEFTSLGKRLIAGLREKLSSWDGEQVPPELAGQARDSAMDHRARWRIRNIAPDPHVVTELASAWADGAARPEYLMAQDIVDGGPAASVDTVRFRLWHLWLTAPEEFLRLSTAERGDAEFAEVSAADIAYVQGDYALAARLYRQQIDLDPDPVGSWVGLALAQRRQGDEQAAAALLAQPELVLAVYKRLRGGRGAVDLEALSRWLDRSTVHMGRNSS